MFSLYLLANIAALTALFLIVRSISSRKSYGPLPPGPKLKPFIGNLLDMPQDHIEQVLNKWHDKWGISILSCLSVKFGITPPKQSNSETKSKLDGRLRGDPEN